MSIVCVLPITWYNSFTVVLHFWGQLCFFCDGVFSAFCFVHLAYLVWGDTVNVGCLLIKTVPAVGFCWLLCLCWLGLSFLFTFISHYHTLICSFMAALHFLPHNIASWCHLNYHSKMEVGYSFEAGTAQALITLSNATKYCIIPNMWVPR